jgi:hypothetical protein
MVDEALHMIALALDKDPRFVIAGFCLIIAGVLNAWLDRLDNVGAFSTSIFAKWKKDFWLKSESANRKYKCWPTGKIVVDHYDDNNRPVFKPAFTFLGLRSDKSLVFLTDGWHLVQFFQWSFVCFAVMFGAGLSMADWRFWLGWVLMRGLLTGAFSVFYDSVFRRGR